MTENESRLTKRNPDGSVGINDFRYYNYADFQKLANKLAEFEDIGTVEEIIKEHKESIELSRRYLIDTNELLEYQAIGTVEQLKAIKQWKSDVMEGFCKYDASSFEEIVVNARAKAIDEFAENLKRKILEEIYDVSDRQKNYEVGSDMSMTCSHIMGTLRDVYHRIVDEIAEQMKAGGK